jgi:hypothetical protein
MCQISDGKALKTLLEIILEIRYSVTMTIEQTIDIPRDRCLSIELPESAPCGSATVVVTVIPSMTARWPDTQSNQGQTAQMRTPLPVVQAEVMDIQDACLDTALHCGRPHEKQSLFKYAGCLKDSGIFEGDAMDIQRSMRSEWPD